MHTIYLLNNFFLKKPFQIIIRLVLWIIKTNVSFMFSTNKPTKSIWFLHKNNNLQMEFYIFKNKTFHTDKMTLEEEEFLFSFIKYHLCATKTKQTHNYSVTFSTKPFFFSSFYDIKKRILHMVFSLLFKLVITLLWI